MNITRGPWFWSGNTLKTRASMGREIRPGHGSGWIVPCDAEVSISKAYGDNNHNRALIAAAPEMLTALAELVAEYDNNVAERLGACERENETGGMIFARQLLAKLREVA